MRKIVVFILLFPFLEFFIFNENKIDILRWIGPEGNEKDLISIKLKSSRKNLLYGCDIYLKSEMKNNSKECIALYSQPYFFVVNGEKKIDNFVLVKKHSRKSILSNYILFGQKKSGGIIWKPIEGDTRNHFLDVSFPIEIILRPSEKIIESIKVPFELYKKYLTKDSIEICIWKGWRKYNREIKHSLIREIILKENKFNLKEDVISSIMNQEFSSVAVENYVYFLHGKQKQNQKNKFEYQLRYTMGIFTDHLSVSNSVIINLE